MNVNKRSVLFAGVLAVLLMLCACGSPDQNTTLDTTPPVTQTQSQTDQSPKFDYPPEVVREFMDGCTGGDRALQAGCECALDALQQEFSFEEFSRIEEDIIAGRQDPKIVTDVMAVCSR